MAGERRRRDDLDGTAGLAAHDGRDGIDDRPRRVRSRRDGRGLRTTSGGARDRTLQEGFVEVTK
jgi:hypothetical protein